MQKTPIQIINNGIGSKLGSMTNQKITNIFSTKNNEDSSDLDDEDIFNWVADDIVNQKVTL